MFYEDILYISYSKYIKMLIFISNMHFWELHLDNIKGFFLNILIFFAPSDSRFSNSCILAKYYPILIILSYITIS